MGKIKRPVGTNKPWRPLFLPAPPSALSRHAKKTDRGIALRLRGWEASEEKSAMRVKMFILHNARKVGNSAYTHKNIKELKFENEITASFYDF